VQTETRKARDVAARRQLTVRVVGKNGAVYDEVPHNTGSAEAEGKECQYTS
jgi:hypothetical protein